MSAKRPDDGPDPARLAIKPVTPDRWPDFERLFESPGAPKYCWCLAWRKTPEETKRLATQTSADREAGRPRPGRTFLKSMMETRIAGGTPVGILAYDGDEPVAWCSVAPRPTFRNIGGPKEDDPGAVWSISCFFVARPWRGRGVARRLVDGAVAYAMEQGARIVEAYPVAADSPSYRFMGFRPMFAVAGFVAAGTAGSRRAVMRLRLDGAGRPASPPRPR